MKERLKEEIELLMFNNRREEAGYTYTVPSPELYPFQWFWDSCFHAIILAHFDPEAAKNELRSVTAKTLPSGLFPHIIYWKETDPETNWGRERRGDIINQSWGVEGTSSLMQPPVLASALLRAHKQIDDVEFLKEMYPRVHAYYRALIMERDPEEIGLIGIINPDESGEDNSPRFDHAQHLDKKHTDKDNLDKRIDRVKENIACNFDAAECMRSHFWVEDVAINAILYRSLLDLAVIAAHIGHDHDIKILKSQAKKVHDAMLKHMYRDGVCYSLEGNERVPIEILTWNIFMPLYAGILTKKQATTLVEEYLLNEKMFWSEYAIPSVALTEKTYQENGFWRGPTWIAPNWFIYHGLKRYEFNDAARALREKSIHAVAKSGFREHYDPKTGEGLGAHDFTWGGLVIDMH